MAKKNSIGHGHRNLHCDICEKPQQWYAQQENLDRHMRVFHNGGKNETEDI